MAQKTTQAVIVLGGRVDNSFTQMGDALLNMGNMVDNISSKLIDFGKESIDTYRDYQTNMLDAEVALSTAYGRGTRELQAVMANLNTQAREWAMQTKFTTEDISNAIAEAAHANWDESQILSGLPSAMQLAQAGGMDLSEALNYVIKTTNAAGIAFDEMPGFIDKWIYAANSSAATVESYGDAFLRLGSSMRFAGSEDELLTLLAAMHDMGAEGTEAATLLRNTMIRLIAPTDKAATAMAFLGVSDEEVNAALAETKGNAKKAAEKLKDLGFSAYDQRGNLKSFLNIFTDLGNTIEGMTEKEQYEVLSSIFPTKTITGALNVLRGLNKEMTLYNDLSSGKAAGYGEYASGVMMSGLEGAQKIYESRLEELKRKTGEALEGDVTWFFETAGNFINSLNGMDDASFSMLVGGLEGIAAAGPALTIAGLGIRGIGYFLGTNSGRIAAGAIAIYALYKALKAYQDATYTFEDNFGNLALDSTQIEAHLKTISKPFEDAQKRIDGYKSSMEAAAQAYTDKSSELAQGIITKMVTGTKLTDQEKLSFYKMGDEIAKNLKAGINGSYEADNQFLVNLFGGKQGALDSKLFLDINSAMQLGYAEATSTADALSKKLRNAMTSAFTVGTLTGDEVANIQSILDEMNDLLAFQTNAANSAKQRELMRKAQTMGIQGLRGLTEQVTGEREKALNDLLTTQDTFYGNREEYYKLLFGKEINGEIVDQTYIDTRLAELENLFQGQVNELYAAYDQILYNAFDNTLRTSGLADDMDYMAKLWSAAQSNPDMQGELYNYLTGRFGTLEANQNLNNILRYYNEMIAAMGGIDEINKRIAYYEVSGNNGMANALRSMTGVIDLIDYSLGFMKDYEPVVTSWVENAGTNYRNEALFMLNLLREGGAKEYFDALQADNLNRALGMLDITSPLAMNPGAQADLQAYLLQLREVYDLEKVISKSQASVVGAGSNQINRDAYAALELMKMTEEEAEQFKIQSEVEFDYEDSLKKMEAEVGAPIDKKVNLVTTTTSTGGGNDSGSSGGGLWGKIKSWFGFAEGGRSDEPAIFGEGLTAEWAIPEAHTPRTASLLTAAAEASGFTWGELASASGSGNNGGSYGDGITVHYSPVIHSDNAGDIDRILREDKQRLRKEIEHILDDRKLYESVVSYT